LEALTIVIDRAHMFDVIFIIPMISKQGNTMEAKTKSARKLTISLPAELVDYADRRAEQIGTSRSQVIGQALTQLMTSEEEELAAEGYRFYSAEAEEFAASSGPAVAEALSGEPEWKE
jgi:hypothetical protein